MLWFFEKAQARLRYEIRRQTDGHDYELVITHPDGREVVERYEDQSAVLERSEQLQNLLAEEGWKSAGAHQRSRVGQ